MARLFVGLMSGSSCDGLDAVLLRIGKGDAPDWQVVQHAKEAYDRPFRERLLHLSAATHPDELRRLDRELADRSTCLVTRLLAEAAIHPRYVTAVGSHGHTACHISPPASKSVRTLQIGDGARMARLTGIDVVSDFRQADIAAGGQGAPLVPAADAILFGRYVPPRGLMILNIGGIANVTRLPVAEGKRAAFDTGPGNMLCDALARRASGGRLEYDRDGELAARGKVVPELLQDWLESPFFSIEPPRTASREDFGEAFLDGSLQRHPGHPPENLVRSALELTVRSVREAIVRWILPIVPRSATSSPLWLAGGGARNSVLASRLADEMGRIGIEVSPLEAHVPLDATQREAAAFAVLARETLDGRPGNWPEATGAIRAVVLGRIHHSASGTKAIDD